MGISRVLMFYGHEGGRRYRFRRADLGVEARGEKSNRMKPHILIEVTETYLVRWLIREGKGRGDGGGWCQIGIRSRDRMFDIFHFSHSDYNLG